LKNLVIVFLSILVLVQPMARIGVLASFQLNQARIAKDLCEKRLVSANTCQGKCHLRKQLKKIAEAERKANSEQETATEKQIPIKPLILPTLVFNELGSIHHSDSYFCPTSKAFIPKVFHPPSFLS